jgi:hypothetical protein
MLGVGNFDPKYTAAQREAAAIAYVDLGMRPAARVVAAAKAGTLRLGDEPVPACEMPEATVRDLARELRNRRAGKVKSETAAMPARDAAEALKRNLAAMCEQEIAAESRRRVGKRDPERIRQLARAAREIAAIPDRADPNPRTPGRRDPETGAMSNGGATVGGLAGTILKAHGQGPQRTRGNAGQTAAPETPSSSKAHVETHTQAQQASETTSAQGTEGEGVPGSWASEQASALVGALEP